jgi:iron complex transport system permease protein
MTIGAFNALMLLLLALGGVAGVSIGSAHVAWPFTAPTDGIIVWLIRVPRVLVGATVGAGLATSGVVMQGLFRNPLAEPGLLGVGPGAVLGAIAVFVTGWAAQMPVALPIGAGLSSLFVLGLVYAAASTRGVAPITHLLLIGIAAGSLCTAVSSLLIALNATDWQSAQEIVFWMMGGVDARSWLHVWLSAPFVVIGILSVTWKARELDLLAIGEERAASLGVDVESSKWFFITTAALLTGVSVAVAGLLGFVGLVVPNAVRLVVGPRHRALCPASALAGAAFVVACDLVARTAHPPLEIRLGIVTALIGSPVLMLMLSRRLRSRGAR